MGIELERVHGSVSAPILDGSAPPVDRPAPDTPVVELPWPALWHPTIHALDVAAPVVAGSAVVLATVIRASLPVRACSSAPSGCFDRSRSACRSRSVKGSSAIEGTRPGRRACRRTTTSTGIGAPGPPRPTATSDRDSSGPALSVDRLSKRFGERIAFADLSFEVGQGEVFGFLGPNGAGKTTTVRTLGTLLAPTTGSATVAGIPLTPENGVEIRRRISIMPESPGLYLKLTVRENLECFADLYEVPEPRARIDSALAAVKLADRAGDACGTLVEGPSSAGRPGPGVTE